MKHFSRTFKGLGAILLLVVLMISVSASSFGVGTVNASGLHLRTAPSTSSASLALVPRGFTVEVLEDAMDGWYRVNYNGTDGYMSAQYLLVTPTGASEGGETGNTAVYGRITLKAGSLNIRTTPDDSGSRLGTIPNGTVVELSEQLGEWYLVTYHGITGYIAAKYITIVDVPVDSNGITGDDVVAEAMKYLGRPYSYGKAGPNSFDCSGFTSYVYKQMGYSLTRTASTQLKTNGVSIAYSDLKVGDLVFFRDPGSSSPATHVGIYIGNGDLIHASSTSSRTGVKISSLSESWYAKRYVGAKRILA